MTTGPTRRRRTAQQILLRRACLGKSVSKGQGAVEEPAKNRNREKGGIVVLPMLGKDFEATREMSSSRAVKKLQRILAANTYRDSGERKSAGKLPGCENLKKDSTSWRKVKLSENRRNHSGHRSGYSSRGSTRSRHSSSTYPSSWPFTVSRGTEEAKGVDSKDSLDEIINCSCLNRTPYDHKLSTPLKSDNSCQCTIKRKSRRRNKQIKAFSAVQAQTLSNSRNHSSEDRRNCRCSQSSEVGLSHRVCCGEEVRPDRSSSKSNSVNSKHSSNCKLKSPGVTFQNYGGYSPSETDIETAAEYNPSPHCRCSKSFFNEIEKVSRPPCLYENKWSLKIASNTEMQEYLNRIDHETECLPNNNFSESHVRKSRTRRASNEQFACQYNCNKTRQESDRRMCDSLEGNYACQFSSTEQDRVCESSRRNSEASISSPRNLQQFPCKDESENDHKCPFIYECNTIQNGADAVTLYQSNTYEYSTKADPSYNQLLPREGNFCNKISSDDFRWTHPKQQLQCGACEACMAQNEQREDRYKLGLGIGNIAVDRTRPRSRFRLITPIYSTAGNQTDPTDCTRRSRLSRHADRMGDSRRCGRTGNGDIENDYNPSKNIGNRRCTEAVTQTSECLMTPRTSPNAVKPVKCPLEGTKYIPLSSPLHSINTSIIQQQNEVKCIKDKSCKVAQSVEKSEEQSNSPILQSEKNQIYEEQTSSVELIEKPSNQETRCTFYNSTCQNESSPKKAQLCNCTTENHRQNSRKSERTCPCQTNFRSHRKNIKSCEEENCFQGSCESYNSSHQIEDKCDVIKILGILQKTVAGLEMEIKKGKGYESGRSSRCGYEPKINKRACAARVDSMEKSCGQNRISAQDPKSRSPGQQGYSSPPQQHNFPQHGGPCANTLSQPFDGIDPGHFGTQTNPYTYSSCKNGAGNFNGLFLNNIYQERKAPHVDCNFYNRTNQGNLEIPHMNGPDPGKAGRYTGIEQAYRQEPHAYPCKYSKPFETIRSINPQGQQMFPNTGWYGNNPQSNVAQGNPLARTQIPETLCGKFGNPALKDSEFVTYQSMYNAVEAPPINRCGLSFQQDYDFVGIGEAQPYQSEYGNSEGFHDGRDSFPASRTTNTLCKGPQNADTAKKSCFKDHRRQLSCSPKCSKRFGSAKRRVNKCCHQPKKIYTFPKTRKETDFKVCENPKCSKKKANILQCPLKLNRASNKSNLSNKQSTNNNNQRFYKVLNSKLCENPSCPYKKNNRKSKTTNMCQSPKCPDRVPKNIGCRYNIENTNELCENPNCRDKKKDLWQEDGYKDERFEENYVACQPDCTDNKNQTNFCNADDTDSSSEDCAKRNRVLFTDVDQCMNSTKNRQGSGRSDRFNGDSSDTESCCHNKYYQNLPFKNDQFEVARIGRSCEIETKKRPQLGECNQSNVQPTSSIRNRYNPYLRTGPRLNSYEKYILRNFEKAKQEKIKTQEVSPFVDSSKNQTPPNLCKEYSDEEKSNSIFKPTICSCDTNSPKEETKPRKKVSGPQRETKTQDNPRSKQSESSGFICCKQWERRKSKREEPKQIKENPKKVEKTSSKSSVFSSFNKKEKRFLSKKERRRDDERESQSERTTSKSSGFFCFKKKQKAPVSRNERRKNVETENEKTKLRSSGFPCFKKKEKPYISERERRRNADWEYDSARTTSKSSGFFCFKKKANLPQSDKETRRNFEKENVPENEKAKSSGFLCSKKNAKLPQSEKETVSRNEKVKSKSTGLPCFKNIEKPPPNERGENWKWKSPNISEKEMDRRVETEIESPKPKREVEQKEFRFNGFQCSDRKPTKKEEEVIPKREEKTRKQEKIKKPSKCSEFFNSFRKPKTEKKRGDEQPSSRTDYTHVKKEKVRPDEICPCSEDHPKDSEEVKVLFDSSYRFSPESRSCAEIPQIQYCTNNPQEPGVQNELPSSGTFCRQRFNEVKNKYQLSCANGFFKIVQ